MNSLPQADAGFQPYIGLKPFTEQEKDRFFGRDREISILLDKIRANRLTLLLAASGVGKSSLLQAGIMPVLRTDSNIELIYHRDWAASPQAFKQAVSDHYGEPYKDNVSLKSILRACTLFSSGQQIILLDQFEEFFNYQRFRAEFLPFIEELSAAILDRSLPASFVFSMREDFALELNAFKPFLPGVFDSYFRLEKLTRDQARLAIEEPLKPTGWRFEQDSSKSLLEEVLNDLAKREQERQFGVQELLNLNELPLLVEPPHLQIVCQELWQHHRDEAAKQITHKAYEQAGRAKGILESYFLSKIQRFSKKDQAVASAAFDHLVGQRATKVAHPLERLAELTRADANALKLMLDKLQDCAVLRRQKRGEEFWYELYHDIFSESIDKWNREFKHRQRIRRIAFRSIAVLFAGGFFLVGNNWRANYYGRYEQLSPKSSFSDRIELYQGTVTGLDIFHQGKFLFETPFIRKDIEADKLFNLRPVVKNNRAEQEIVSRLSSSKRFSGYMKDGFYQDGYNLADCILGRNNQDDLMKLSEQFSGIRSKNIIPKAVSLLRQAGQEQQMQIVVALHAEEAISEIRKYLTGDNDSIQIAAVKALAALHDNEFTDHLKYFLTHNSVNEWYMQGVFSLIRSNEVIPEIVTLLKNEKPAVQTIAVNALSALRANEAIPEIRNLLKSGDSSVQEASVKALAELGVTEAIPDIRQLLKNGDPLLQTVAIRSLAKLSDNESIHEIKTFLNDRNEQVRSEAVTALVEFHDSGSIPEIRKLVKNREYSVRNAAIQTLASFGDKVSIPGIRIAVRDTYKYSFMRSTPIKALAILHDKESIPDIRKYLSKDTSATDALGILGDRESIPQLRNIIHDDKIVSYIKSSKIKALSTLRDYDSSPAIREFLNNLDENTRASAIEALATLRDNEAIPEIRKHLDDGNAEAQVSAIEALGELHDSKPLPEFRRLLNSWNAKAQTAAVKALGILRDSSSIPEISKRLADRYPEMQFAAAQALARIGFSSPQLQAWQQQHFNEVQEKMAVAYPQERIEAARSLANIFTPQAVELLGRLAQDEEQPVVIAAVASIGIIGEYHPGLVQAQADKLLSLLKHPDLDMRETAITSLGQLISFRGEKKAADFPELDQRVRNALSSLINDQQQKTSTRLTAIDALGDTGREECAQFLFELLPAFDRSKEEALHSRCLFWLGRMNYAPARDYVENELHKLEQAKAEWRTQRDQNSGSIADKNDAWWQVREYRLGSALARIAPIERGIELLGHPLYQVREGAVRALAAKADAALIGTIIQAHQDFNPDELPSPFPYTAFQAIDLALWNLEYTGKQEDVTTLQDIRAHLKPCRVPGQEGAIEERLEWTIKRLEEKLKQDEKQPAVFP